MFVMVVWWLVAGNVLACRHDWLMHCRHSIVGGLSSQKLLVGYDQTEVKSSCPLQRTFLFTFESTSNLRYVNLLGQLW